MSPRPRKASDEEVFAAAHRAMSRLGPAQLTLAEIAVEAGVTGGALVQRFGSKHRLLLAMMSGMSSSTRDFFAQLRAAHGSPLAALYAYADCFAQMGETPARLAHHLSYLQLDLTDPDFYQHTSEQARATRAELRELLEGAVATGELAPGVDITALARGVEVTLSGSLMTWAFYRDGAMAEWMREDLDRLFAAHRPAAGLPPSELPLECVPNVSEGRRPEVVARLAAAVSSVAGVRLLDVSSDPDHNRSVLTLAGDADGLHAALLALYEAALDGIDLTRHQGVHPRVGAVDVVPFVPLGDTPMAVAVAAAERLAEEVARRFGLPVYLYERAARGPGRTALADVRRGGFEGFPAKIADPAWRPDFGPAQVHPTAGVTVIGARFFLIAFNAVLETVDVGIARAVARKVRESGGGLPAVRAMGVYLASRGLAQVSMNLVDYRRTSILCVLDRVREEAAKLGTRVLESEVIGLIPEAAARGVVREALLLPSPPPLLEERLREVTSM